MKPITFSCHESFPLAPEKFAMQILNLAKWSDFHGYGPLPGIKVAEFEVRMEGIVGTRIRVTNMDGSSHVEEIVEWRPDQRIRLEFKEFSPPVSRLATRFVETWEFQRVDGETKVVRSFELHPKTKPARFVLWLISFFLRRAIARHLQEMKASGIASICPVTK